MKLQSFNRIYCINDPDIMNLYASEVRLEKLLSTNNLSVEKFRIFCDNIYDYSNINENMNLSGCIYRICEYLDNLLDGPHNEMTKNFLMSFSLYYDKNTELIEKMESYFYKLIPENMFYFKEDYFNGDICCNDVSMEEDRKPVFRRLPKLIERQINYTPPPHRNHEILTFISQLLKYIDDNDSLYSNINYYVYKITLELMEIHSNIMKLELVRNGKYSGTALDIVINYLHDGLLEKQKECRYWIKFISKIPKQVQYNYYENKDYSYCKELHIKRGIMEYNHIYGLPISVLLESAHNPHLWKYVNRKKLRHSIFRNIELKPPKIVDGRLILDN